MDATLEKFSTNLKEPFNSKMLSKCDIKTSFMTYSLVNFLFRNYVLDSIYDDETGIFENVVLCQADVGNKDHKNWVELVAAGKRVYVTINENDFVLKWSDINFQKNRLGRTAKNLNAQNTIYFDFTDGPNVGKTHGLFYKKNSDVKNFFTSALKGNRAESTTNLKYNAKKNAYEF